MSTRVAEVEHRLTYWTRPDKTLPVPRVCRVGSRIHDVSNRNTSVNTAISIHPDNVKSVQNDNTSPRVSVSRSWFIVCTHVWLFLPSCTLLNPGSIENSTTGFILELTAATAGDSHLNLRVQNKRRYFIIFY